jgi:tape measure domain-containing protein
MAIAGTLTYDTKLDSSGLEEGVKSTGNTIKNIVAGLGITKLISTAINTISSSLDDAISRVDTLNNFPKVMETLGYSTESATKSISKLSDGIEGLPTTLDEIVGNAQLLTASLDDLDKGTETAIALNDMFLAGGQGSEAASRALTQYNQILAKGKVDQQSWNTLIEVAPGQMNQLAKSLLGASANQKDLYEALKEGTLSIEDMNNEVIRLDTEGGESFSSFAEQAQGATGGIETSITNVKTAITKGIANSITAINEGLEKANLPTIQEMLANLKGYINSFFKEINEKIPPIISKIVELYDKIKPYIPIIEAVAGSILAIVAAIKIWNTVTMTITAVQKALTIVMEALNLVMSMNPIALIVLAIIGLVAAFVILWNKCEWFRNFWIGLWDKIKSVFETAWDAIGTFFTETIPNWINAVIEWFKNLPYNIGYAIGQIIGHIINLGTSLWNWVTNDLPQIINNIVEWFKSLPGKIWTWLVNVVNKVGEWGTNLKNKGTEAAKKLFDSIVSTVIRLPDKMKEIGKNIVEGIWNGIKNAKDWLVGKIKSFASGITDGIKDALGIHSPSTIMRDKVGKFIPSGIAAGIEANTKSIDKAVDKMNDEMLSKMQSAVNMETGKISANATVRSNANYNSMIYVNASFDGNVEMDNTKVGRIVAPSVARTIKAGGLA